MMVHLLLWAVYQMLGYKKRELVCGIKKIQNTANAAPIKTVLRGQDATGGRVVEVSDTQAVTHTYRFDTVKAVQRGAGQSVGVQEL